MENGFKIICPFCSKPWTQGMMEAELDASEAETSECVDVNAKVEIRCENCKKIVYVKEFSRHQG